MIVAITGGTGFVGRCLVARHAARGDAVRVLTRRKPSEIALGGQVELFHGDLLSDVDAIPPFVRGADILYHCAGEARQPERMFALHVEGTRRLIGAARGRIGRWMQLSSVGVYGHRENRVVTEATRCEPQGQYEQTKYAADALIVDAAARGAFEHSILRPSIVFGPSMTNRSLFQWITMISRGLFCFVGPPGASANYIFVDNVVAAIERCAVDSRARGRIFNLSDGCTIEVFVAMIAAALGRPVPTLRLPIWPLQIAAGALRWCPRFPLTASRIQAMCCRTRYPCDAIASELGYRHLVSLEQGVRRTVARWREMQMERTR
jgi:nucleoside-diphosphate-sugar epimerase